MARGRKQNLILSIPSFLVWHGEKVSDEYMVKYS